MANLSLAVLLRTSGSVSRKAESDALFQAACDLTPEFVDLRDRMMAMPARTHRGLHAKGQVLEHHCENEDRATWRMVQAYIGNVLALIRGAA